MRYFAEDIDLGISLRNVELVESLRTPHHQWDLLRHQTLGFALVMDGELQHVEAWQALYHEPLVHVPAAFVPTIQRALVLGGGSLFAAAEVLRYPTVEECILVDHDAGVLELMARHYEHASAVLNDRRFRHDAGDALGFVSRSEPKFDLIINDATDIVVTHEGSEVGVLKALSEILAHDGVCADVIYRHMLDEAYIARTLEALKQRSPYALSLVFVPEYPGILHLLSIWGSHRLDQRVKKPINRVQRAWAAGQRPHLQFYNPNFLHFYLHLPPYVRARLSL